MRLLTHAPPPPQKKLRQLLPVRKIISILSYRRGRNRFFGRGGTDLSLWYGQGCIGGGVARANFQEREAYIERKIQIEIPNAYTGWGVYGGRRIDSVDLRSVVWTHLYYPQHQPSPPTLLKAFTYFMRSL